MDRYAYIFVNRNFGHDYAYAYPPLGLIRGWFWEHYIKADVKQALDARLQNLKDATAPEEFKELLASGISAHTYSHRHTIYSVKIVPDTLCPDPRAAGRCPHFVMYLLMPGAPEVISKRFGEFRAKCQEIAWHTMRSGEQNELKLEIPDNFYL